MVGVGDRWTDEDVQVLLALYATEEVQRDLEGSHKNKKIYSKISSQLENAGIHHTEKQCREKIKKLKQDYKKIKDHNSQQRGIQKTNKWYYTLDQILGHLPAYSGNAAIKDSAKGLLGAIVRGENIKLTEECLGETAPEPTSLIQTAPAATSIPCCHRPETAPEPTSLIQTAPAATSIPCCHRPGSAPEPTSLIQTAPAATSIPCCHRPETATEPTSLIQTDPAATSIPCHPTPGTAPEPTSISLTSPAASSAPCRPRPGKRKRADSILATVHNLLESDAEQRRQSDARFDSMLQLFQEEAQREAEERMALREEVAEAKRLHASFMEGLLGVMNMVAARQGGPPN